MTKHLIHLKIFILFSTTHIKQIWFIFSKFLDYTYLADLLLDREQKFFFQSYRNSIGLFWFFQMNKLYDLHYLSMLV